MQTLDRPAGFIVSEKRSLAPARTVLRAGAMVVRIGISGWRYTPWRGVFYPEDLPQRAELAFASQRLRTIEINGTFYSLQRAPSFRAWRDATPDDFVFAVKGSRFVTHMKRLLEVERPLANFFASGVLELEHKLGPFLWQFPESFAFDAERFESFFELLPRDTHAAAELTERRIRRILPRATLGSGDLRQLRHAVEVRSPTFATSEFVELLRRHRIALVVADTAGKWPYFEDVTADFVYLRLHGNRELYSSGYTDAALARWARRIRSWSSGAQPRDAVRIAPSSPPRRASRDVYAYFDNDIKVHAPFDAMTLARSLGADRGTVLHGAPLPKRAVVRPLRRENRSNPWRTIPSSARRPNRRS
jgi:uncharacterized protein YecE (DUF72 family)